MNYNSPRVTEPNAFQVGAGLSGGSNYLEGTEIFMKYGFEGGFDFGIHWISNPMPTMIGLSVKKQFELNKPYIDAVNFEYGLMGLGLIIAPFSGGMVSNNFIGTNLILDNWSLQFRMQKELIGLAVWLDPTYYETLTNSYQGRISYNFKINNHNILLFSGISYETSYTFPDIGGDGYPIEMDISKTYDIYRWNKGTNIFVGISYYFDIHR